MKVMNGSAAVNPAAASTRLFLFLSFIPFMSSG
jgi:hypothetical protein